MQTNKKLVITIISIFLILSLSACSSHPAGFGENTFSVEELVKAASPAIAYIETAFGSGSGFVISSKGIVVTNFHVLVGADEASVEIAGQTYLNPVVLAANEDMDIAILKVPATNLTWLPPVKEKVEQGETVIALGNPGGFKGSVSQGIISSTDRVLEGGDLGLIQTTAPISPGSSGGPLLNLRGEFVGITTFTYESGQNLNFAIPADAILSVRAETETGQPLSKVFGSESESFYKHSFGDLAVSLSWDGTADMDLEVWSDELAYLGSANLLGECRDVTFGKSGEEYFVFQNYPSTEFTTEHELQRDFSSGRFIISPFYNQGSSDSSIASLTVFFPDGSTQEFNKELDSLGRDQWVAILVDVDRHTVKLLDFFPAADLIGFLEWDSSADLDLVVWDFYYEDFFIPVQFDGQDVQNGLEGIEVFQFGSFSDYDFSSGLMDIDVWMANTGNPVTAATFTLLHQGEKIDSFSHQFTPDSRGDYYWQVISLDAETLEYSVQEEVRHLLTD